MSWILSAFADEAGPTTDEQIAALQRAGYHWIDPRLVEGHNISELPVPLAREVAAKLAGVGIGVNMFGSPLGKIDLADDFQIDLNKLRHLGALAEVFDCRSVRIFSYFNKGGLPVAVWREQALDRLGQLRELAAELGLVLYHENEKHIFGDILEHVQAIAALRNEHFKLIFDFDNYNQCGNDTWQNWEALRDQTDAIHLKDSDAQNQHTVVGQGAGQVEKILRDAVARGWQGPLSLEPHLKHSGAVAATGPSGQANQSFRDLSPADCFHIAATGAQELLTKVGATVA